MKKLCLCLLLCLLVVSAQADEIFGGAFPSEAGYMADDGTQIYHDRKTNTLSVISAESEYSIVLPQECKEIWQMDYTDPETFIIICRVDAGYAVLPIQDGAMQPAVTLPENAAIIHRPLGEHVYYHTKEGHRLCRFNWKTGEETELLTGTGGLYHADRWRGVDYLVFTLPDEVGEYKGCYHLMTVDADGNCSEPLPLPFGGLSYIYSSLCVGPDGNVLIAASDAENTGTLYSYTASGKLMWQADAACRVSRLIPTREGYTVIGHRNGLVTQREIDLSGRLLNERVYKAFAPTNQFPVVNGEVYYFSAAEEHPFFWPLE